MNIRQGASFRDQSFKCPMTLSLFLSNKSIGCGEASVTLTERDFQGRLYEWCWRIGSLAVIVGLPWYFGLFDRDYGNKNLSSLINALIFGGAVYWWWWGNNKAIAQMRKDRQRVRDFKAAKAAGDEEEMWRLMLDRIKDN